MIFKRFYRRRKKKTFLIRFLYHQKCYIIICFPFFFCSSSFWIRAFVMAVIASQSPWSQFKHFFLFAHTHCHLLFPHYKISFRLVYFVPSTEPGGEFDDINNFLTVHIRRYLCTMMSTGERRWGSTTQQFNKF